jgi:hypothetical protein
MTINGVVYEVIKAGSEWTEQEKMALIDISAEWHLECQKDLGKKTTSQIRLWCEIYPEKMALKFGKVRNTPDNYVSNSPYKSQLATIRSMVSDYKALKSPDAPEEEQPNREGPSGNI